MKKQGELLRSSKRRSHGKRFLAALLCLCLVVGPLPVTAFAEGEQDSGATIGTSGLCEHHAAHDESCGYAEGTEETPCAHEHAWDCYTLVTECVHIHTAECYPADSVSGNEAIPSDAAEPICVHECSEESGCITKTPDCKHEHDGTCGYAPSTEGTPCGFVCEVCNPQDSGVPEVAEPKTECLCTEPCTEDSVNEDCPACGTEGTDLTACEGVEAQPTALSVMALAADGDTVYVGGVTLSGSTSIPVYATTNNAGEVITDGATAENYNIKWDGSTLTLKDATIKKEFPHSASPPGSIINGAAIGIYNQSGNAELTIQLEGQNTLSETSTGIFVYSPDNGGEASLTITGSGSLTANSTSNATIQVQSNSSNATLTIQDADVTATATYGDSVCVQSGESSKAALTVNGGSLTVSGNPGIQYSLGSGESGSGIPSLTVGGNAVVDANGGISTNSSTDLDIKTGSDTSGGIVFDGNNGTVYGDVTLQEDLTIHAGESLTIGQGASLDTGGHTLTVDGGTLNGDVAGNVIYKVTSVTLNPTSLTLTAGDTVALTATVEPTNATDKVVTWSSSPSGIVTITPDTSDSTKATVTAEGAGSTTITATAEDKSATCAVTVHNAPHIHSFAYKYSDGTGHWQECSDASCPDTDKGKTATTAHDFDNNSDTTCDTCGYTRTITPSHTHSYGDWVSNGDGTHTRTCSADSSHTEDGSCSGGTATCKDKAICSVCGVSYGSINPGGHTGGTKKHSAAEATTTAEGYTGDTYCLGCNMKIATGQRIPKKNSGDLSQTVDGKDIPTGGNLSDLNPGISTTANTIPATGDTEYIIYTVQKGDTLWAIAKKYGCTVSEIVSANSDLIKDPNLIYAGWQLKIPQAGVTGTGNTPDAILPDDKKTIVYIVKQGDTLWAISQKFDCTVAEIVALNGELITAPDLILVGWELLIPQN